MLRKEAYIWNSSFKCYTFAFKCYIRTAANRFRSNTSATYPFLWSDQEQAQRPVLSAKIPWKGENWGIKTSSLSFSGHLLPQSALRHFRKMWLDGKGWSRDTISGQSHCKTPAVPLPPLTPRALQVTNKEEAAAKRLGESAQQAGQASTSLQNCPVKVRPAPHLWRSLISWDSLQVGTWNLPDDPADVLRSAL